MKKKLKLDAEMLSVEAFATGPAGQAAMPGTVRANAFTETCRPEDTGLLTFRSDCTVPPTLKCPPRTDYSDCQLCPL